MNRPWLLFFTPLVLYGCWLSYLCWMVVKRPIQAPGYALVLSRPQFLASPIDIIAEIPQKTGKAKVVEVLYPKENAPVKPGDEILLRLIDECRPVLGGKEAPRDWEGPGNYLVPMRPAPGAVGEYEVMAIPTSPGFRSASLSPPVRIYRDSAETRAQYARISKP
ncbi:MAG: hypothetical protein SNJ75_08420 [Gemmataceae bacterium]